MFYYWLVSQVRDFHWLKFEKGAWVRDLTEVTHSIYKNFENRSNKKLYLRYRGENE